MTPAKPDRLYVGEAPPAGASDGSSSSALPSDLRSTAARRVATLGFVLAAVWAYVPLRVHLVDSLLGIESHLHGHGHLAEVAPVMIAISLALAWAARSDRVSDRITLRMGLVYEVVTVCALTLPACLALGFPDAQSVRGVPAGAAFMMVFPALVPVSWRRRLVTTGLSALAIPASMAAAVALGTPAPSAAAAAVMLLPVGVCACIALAVARVLGSYSTEVRKARDEARELGSYRLTEMLGKGGMGEVWRAEHRLLARPAAVKVIRPANLDGDPERRLSVIARFEREARATAALTAPETITIFDFGTMDDGSFYYVMELLDGLDLDTIVEKHGPLLPERVIHLLVQACASLAEAHEHGMVHRDVKPANLFVARLGGRHDRLKVLDFGLVRSTDTGEGDSQTLTQVGSVVGTPLYIAPEAVLGEKVDGRGDVYCLACVAYFLLTGTPPFKKGSAMATMIAHARDPRPRLADHVSTPLPEGLSALIDECLRVDRTQRPSTAKELGARLTALPVASPWTDARAAAWWAEHDPAEAKPA